jgi:hypothetical protein
MSNWGWGIRIFVYSYIRIFVGVPLVGTLVARCLVRESFVGLVPIIQNPITNTRIHKYTNNEYTNTPSSKEVYL